MIDLKANPFFLNDDDIARIEHIFESMSIEEKIGQLFVPIGYSSEPEYLNTQMLKYHIGGIMYRPGSSEDMYNTHRYLQEHSEIPLLIGANLEYGGNGIATDGTFFGQQMQVAATDNPEQAYRLGKICCLEGRAVGCNWAFAPVVDIDLNWRNPITNVRTYGNDPKRVLEFARQYIRAANEAGLAVTLKHFPGDGCDEVDQHILTSVNTMSRDEWDKSFGMIYRHLIEEGALSVMVGHIALPAYQHYFNPDHPKKIMPASLSPELLQNLLRDKLNFNGLIVTDSTCMVGFSSAMERARAVPFAIEAGCDMFLFNKDLSEDFEFMMAGYRQGILSEKRLHEAVMRILGMKAALGLIGRNRDSLVPGKEELQKVGNKTHRNWAAECADNALTLVKDIQDLLPINPRKHRKVLLQVLGGFPAEDRIRKTFKDLLQQEGFQVELYEYENFETARFDVATFKANYDLIIYLANVENASNKVTNRLSWYTFWGNGNNVPWFVEERPTLFISLANPYHLIDVPMVKTYINCYSNSDTVLHALIEKLTGRSEFTGKSPVDPFLGKEYLRW